MYGSCKFSPCVASKYKDIWYVQLVLFIYLFSKACELAVCFAFPSTSVSEGCQLVAGEILKPFQTMAQ